MSLVQTPPSPIADEYDTMTRIPTTRIAQSVSQTTFREPMKLIHELKERYRQLKNLFRETRDHYYQLNLFVFYLPILFVQAITTRMTHAAQRTDVAADKVGYLKVTVVVLNGLLAVWTAAQLKLGWNDKTRSANSALIRYRKMSSHTDIFSLILDCMSGKAGDMGVSEFFESCYKEEMHIGKTEPSVPAAIYRRRNRKYPSRKNKKRSNPYDIYSRAFTFNYGVAAGLHMPTRPSSSFRQHNIDIKSPRTSQAVDNEPDETITSRAGHFDARMPNMPRQSDSNTVGYRIDTRRMLGQMLTKYRYRKDLFMHLAKHYYSLSLSCFYMPLLLLGSANTIMASITMFDKAKDVSASIIVLSSVSSVLTGLQMYLQWESESCKCDETHRMYKKLETEVLYRQMIEEQTETSGIQDLCQFAWMCIDTEDKTLDSLPYIPKAIFKKHARQHYFTAEHGWMSEGVETD